MRIYSKLIIALAAFLAVTACKNNGIEPKQKSGEETGVSYRDNEVFVSLIPYPCTQWGATESDIVNWEKAHGGVLNESRSKQLSTEYYDFLWFDIKSEANPFRGYFLTGRKQGSMVEAIGYYNPCDRIISEDGTKINETAESLLVENKFEYSGIVNGYHQYTSSKMGKILKITRTQHDGKLYATVNYCRKPN